MFKIIIIIIGAISLIKSSKWLVEEIHKSDNELRDDFLKESEYASDKVLFFIAIFAILFIDYFYYVFALKETIYFVNGFKFLNLTLLIRGIIEIGFMMIFADKSTEVKENKLSQRDVDRYLNFYKVGTIITLLIDILMTAGVLILFFIERL